MIVKENPPLAITSMPEPPPFKREPKVIGQRWNVLFDNFSSFDVNPRASLLEELRNSAEDDRRILWYPSAGVDYTDVRRLSTCYFQNGRTYENPPKIFVHTDQSEFMVHDEDGEEEALIFQKKWKASLKKIPNTDEFKWLIQISIDNYDFLHFALMDGIKIPYLYTACDGGTSGMDGNSKFPITTYYLTQFYQKLGVQYHVTEYFRKFFEEDSERIIENLEREVPHLIKCYPDIGSVRTDDFSECFFSLTGA
jgi:hypothetical protein